MEFPVDDQFVESLTFQDYAAGPRIAGVTVQPLRKHRAPEGSFMELLRLTDGKIEALDGQTEPFDARQLSFSTAVPGRINAFHLHPKRRQDELWCAVAGELLVWLVDVRAGSPTLNVRQRVVLSGEAPALLFIPTGVAHGYKAGPSGATLLYTMNSQFDLADPNEGRLPWDVFGTDLWEEDRG